MTNLVSRAQWGASAPKSTGNLIAAHPLGTAIHYSAANAGNSTHDKCERAVRGIQEHHMTDTKDPKADIAYSFLACQHGYLFTGRGTGKGSAANGTTQANSDFYAVCALVGPKDTPTPQLVAAIGDGITLCRAAGAGVKVIGHRDVFATSCPGARLYKMVESNQWHAGLHPAPTKPAAKPAVVVRAAPLPASLLLVVDGDFGPATRKRLQWWAGVAQDGSLGPASWRAVQRKTGAHVDGVVGPNTWKALQRMVGVTQDGAFGTVSVKALQRFLNSY